MAKDSSGIDGLKNVSRELFRNLGDTALDRANDSVSGLTQKLTDIGEGGGQGVKGKAIGKAGEAVAQGDNPVLGGLKGAASGVKDKVKDKITGGGGGGGKGGKATKSTNIVETIDVGVPLKVAYNQWTEFGAFPSFMKKVENVEAQEDNKIKFKAQIFLSHREWEATILEQIPDERIVWRSSGKKGHVDGAVTFHEIGHNLTRILVVLEYYPQGLFEKTGNIWEAQGRRARAELRHFRRHVMTRTILEPEEVEGWRGTIEDSEVVETHEEALEREQQEQEEQEQEDWSEEESEGGPDDAEEGAEEGADEEEPEGYADEEEPEGYAEEDEAPEEYEEAPEEPEEDYEEAPEDAEEDYAEEEPEAAEEDYEEAPEEPADEAAEDEEEAPEEEYEEEYEEPEDEAAEEEPEEKPRRSRRRRAS